MRVVVEMSRADDKLRTHRPRNVTEADDDFETLEKVSPLLYSPQDDEVPIRHLHEQEVWLGPIREPAVFLCRLSVARNNKSVAKRCHQLSTRRRRRTNLHTNFSKSTDKSVSLHARWQDLCLQHVRCLQAMRILVHSPTRIPLRTWVLLERLWKRPR